MSDELPDLDKQNGVTLGRVLGRGSVGQAEEGSDGKMHGTIRINEDELVYDPTVLVLPHGGDLELEFFNDDKNTHSALFPSNGDKKFLWLLNHSKGRAKLNLDGPGYYWYSSPGGNLTVAFCYPGSLMSVTVTDPAGGQHTAQGKSPVTMKIANGPPGVYKAVVRGVDVPAGGEPYALSFATDAACVEGNVDSGGVVRDTFSNAQITKALTESGANGVTLQVQGTSPTAARIFYYSNLGGMPVLWTVVFYAATPNLGAVITQVSLRGVNVTTQVVSRLSSFGDSITSIPSGFIVDRVYSCTGPGRDGMMVIEGHR